MTKINMRDKYAFREDPTKEVRVLCVNRKRDRDWETILFYFSY